MHDRGREGLRLASKAFRVVMLQAMLTPLACVAQADNEQRAIDRQRQESLLRAVPTPIAPARPAVPGLRGPIEGEAPCFVINRVDIRGNRGHIDDFDGGPIAQRYEGRCLGRESIGNLVADIDAQLGAIGAVTSTSAVPSQSLQRGELVVDIIPGRIESIAIVGGDGTWRSGVPSWAVPLRTGDVLRLQAIDQSIEALAWPGSPMPTAQISPGSEPMTSRIVIELPHVPRWWAHIEAHNEPQGDFGAGAIEAVTMLPAMTPFGERWTLTAARTLRHFDQNPGSVQAAVQAEMPIGWHALSLRAGAVHAEDRVSGTTVAFDTARRELTLDAGWSTVIFRDHRTVVRGRLGIGFDRARSKIEGVELLLQRRDEGRRAVGFQMQRRLSSGQWRVDVTHTRQRARALPALAGADASTTHAGTTRLRAESQMTAADSDLSHALSIDAQTTPRPLPSSPVIVAGTWDTVPGFRHGDQIVGHRGAVIAYEASIELPARTQGARWRHSGGLSLASAANGHGSAGWSALASASWITELQLNRWRGSLQVALPLHQPSDFASRSPRIRVAIGFTP